MTMQEFLKLEVGEGVIYIENGKAHAATITNVRHIPKNKFIEGAISRYNIREIEISYYYETIIGKRKREERAIHVYVDYPNEIRTRIGLNSLKKWDPLQGI